MSIMLQGRVIAFGDPIEHLAVMLHFSDGNHYYASWGPTRNTLSEDAYIYWYPVREMLLPELTVSDYDCAQDFMAQLIDSDKKSFEHLFCHYIKAKVHTFNTKIQPADDFHELFKNSENPFFSLLTDNCAQHVWKILHAVGYKSLIEENHLGDAIPSMLPTTFARKVKRLSTVTYTLSALDDNSQGMIVSPAFMLNSIIKELNYQRYNLNARGHSEASQQVAKFYHAIDNLLHKDLDELAAIVAPNNTVNPHDVQHLATTIQNKIDALLKDIDKELQTGILAKHRNTLKPLFATLGVCLLFLFGNLVYLCKTPRTLLVNAWTHATHTKSELGLVKAANACKHVNNHLIQPLLKIR